MARRLLPDMALVQRLCAVGLKPTRQRLAVAGVILRAPRHMTADQVLEELRAGADLAPAAIETEATQEPARISRATVYATLAQFAGAGLLRELHTGGDAVVYDSNPSRHAHWVDVDTGEVHDLPDGMRCQLQGLDGLPPGLCVEDVQLVLRVRRQPHAA